MKILLFFLFLTCVQATPNAIGQNINIKLKRVTLEEVLSEVSKQTGLDLVYDSKLLKGKKYLDVNLNNVSLKQALDKLIVDQPLMYEVKKNVLILLPKSYEKQLKSDRPSRINDYQQRTITGKVVDPEGKPLEGVTVSIKGRTIATTTDEYGNYSLTLGIGEEILMFSMVGYERKEIEINGRETIDVDLIEEIGDLEEVVVVGYGAQTKKELIGSVSQVDGSQISKRSVPSLSHALTGQMPGVTIIQRSGQPGSSGGTIQIRGVGSFGAGTGALILVDGIPTNSFNDIDPNDVASVSVLKDASSAAIYGARAANGVILVTTKTGATKNKLTISYNGYMGVQKPTEYPEFVNSWEYATAINETTAGGGGYSAEEIQKFKDGSDPDRYPNTNFFNEFFEKSSVQTGHNINLSNNTEKVQYSFSLGLLNQNGILRKNSYDRYNTRLNIITNIRKNLKLSTRLSGTLTSDDQPAPPATLDFSDMNTIISQVIRYPAIHPIRLSNGDWGPGNNLKGNPISFLESESFYKDRTSDIGANMRLDWSFIPDLTLSAIGGYTQRSSRAKLFRATQRINDNISLFPSSLQQTSPYNDYKTFQALVEYKKQFQQHDFKVLAGYSFEQGYSESFSGFRQNFPTNDLTELNIGSPDGQQNGGTASEWALESLFGRLQYNFMQRYLIEGVIRYDGSSRFSETKKYAVFPSVAAGWLISEEPFIKDQISWLSELKLKGSYGVLGNQNIGNYPYQNILNTGSNYSFGNSISSGLARETIIDPNLKWESTRTSDVGIEGSFLGRSLSFSATYYDRYTYDILVSPSASVSNVLGFDVGLQNSGKLKNKGLEFTLGYQNQRNDWSYGVNLNYSTVVNEVMDLGVGNVNQPNGMVGNGSLFVGLPMQLYYGYKTDGLFVDTDDVGSWADLKAINPSAKPGDIRYMDISGPDGVPDGKVDPVYDRTFLGSRIPKHTFGANLNVSYKNFDLSMLLQGVSGVNGLLENHAGWALYSTANIQRWQYDGRWTTENPDRDAEYPRMEQLASIGSPNTLLSDFWVLNASYLRIKNIQVGYSIPKAWSLKWGIEGLRLNASVENLHTWHKYRTGWDPEINSGGNYYPILRNFSFGLNLNF